MRLIHIVLLLMVALPVTGRAQSGSDGWGDVRLTVYGWIPGVTGTQEYPDGQPVVDLDPVNILDLLKFGFFGTGEIRRGRVGLVLDLAYADLGQDGAARGAIVPGAAPASASVGTRLAMGSAVVAYRVHNEADRWLDVYGGVRAFDIEADVAVDVPALGFQGKRRASVDWVDGIVGLRGHAPLGGRFTASGLADIGGFGVGASSDLAWQVQGTLDHAFTDRLIGRLGYRYMSIDRDDGGLGLDVEIHGPVIGVTWAF